VRREAFVTAVVASFLLACGSSERPRGDGQPLDLKGDVASGCVYGAPLVKVLISLHPTDSAKKCGADVTPASVCVARGGVVRFAIVNHCGEGRGRFEITPPRKKTIDAVHALTDTKAPTPAPDQMVFANCDLKNLRRVDFCDIGQDVEDGFYKYGLEGDIDSLDPDVEVHGGGR